MYTCYIQSFKILASFCSWADWFESYLFENPWRHIFAWYGSHDDLLNMQKKLFLAIQLNQQSAYPISFHLQYSAVDTLFSKMPTLITESPFVQVGTCTTQGYLIS